MTTNPDPTATVDPDVREMFDYGSNPYDVIYLFLTEDTDGVPFAEHDGKHNAQAILNRLAAAGFSIVPTSRLAGRADQVEVPTDVYYVTSTDSMDHEIEAVFSTAELAQEYASMRNEYDYGGELAYEVSVMTINQIDHIAEIQRYRLPLTSVENGARP